jgi:imidazolonepropionase-like amidohydrolase
MNTHVHNACDENNLNEWVLSGVTTVRDLGAFKHSPDEAFSLRNGLAKENRNARLVSAGPIVTTVGGYGNYPVTSPEDAENKINGLIDSGADLIKIAIEDNLQGKTWPMLSQEEINTIVQSAHKRGKKVSAHVSRSYHLGMAINAGVDDVDHMIVNDLPDSLIRRMIEKNIYWIPTLELWFGVSQLYGSNWYTIPRNNLQRFVKAGGKVALGTDYDGYTTHFDLGMPTTEINCMKEAGMTPMQIIVAATKCASYVCGIEDKLGTIEPGKIADIIILDSNPLDDLKSLSNVRMVIHNGEIIKK